MNRTIKLIPAKDCKNHNKGVISMAVNGLFVEEIDDLWVDSVGYVYIVHDGVAHMLKDYSMVGVSHDLRRKIKNFRCFDEDTEGIEFEDGDDFIEIPFQQGGVCMEDKYKWQENYTKFSVQLNNDKDKDIIEKAKRRKDKYNTAISYTMRRWVRLGYELDMKDE